MPKITINNISIDIQAEETILSAAKRAGIHIPTMCWLKHFEPSSSCMLCVVQEQKTGKILTSCSARAEEGMDIITSNEKVEDLRKTALELLLSEHYGDCEAPCQRACPAGMDIPGVNRLIQQSEFGKALQLAKEQIALPAILGHICPAPCEKACRRKDIDQPVAICLLKRFVAEYDLFRQDHTTPTSLSDNGRKLAIIGAGPAGLSAAYYLRLQGFACDLYDKNLLPGGALHSAVAEGTLPQKVLETEIAEIRSLGLHFSLNRHLNTEDVLRELAPKYHYILCTTGDDTSIDKSRFGTDICPDSKEVDIYATDRGYIVFPVLKNAKTKMAVRSVALGKKAAEWITALEREKGVSITEKGFNSVYRPIAPEEQTEFLKDAPNHLNRTETTKEQGYTPQQAISEAGRCLHCDCRKKQACLLRKQAGHYKANARNFQLIPAPLVEKITEHHEVVFEKLKCIKCGICLQTAQQEGDSTGLAFEGRGFNVRVAIPIQRSITSICSSTLIKCAQNCPTGAIALKQT